MSCVDSEYESSEGAYNCAVACFVSEDVCLTLRSACRVFEPKTRSVKLSNELLDLPAEQINRVTRLCSFISSVHIRVDTPVQRVDSHA